MPLTEDEVKYLRSKIGTGEPPTDDELYDEFVRLGSLDMVAQQILDTRLADLLANPASFTVSGEYSQSTAENIKGLQDQIAALEADIEDELGGAVGGLPVVSILEPVPPLAR